MSSRGHRPKPSDARKRAPGPGTSHIVDPSCATNNSRHVRHREQVAAERVVARENSASDSRLAAELFDGPSKDEQAMLKRDRALEEERLRRERREERERIAEEAARRRARAQRINAPADLGEPCDGGDDAAPPAPPAQDDDDVPDEWDAE
eukprot:TRINITY_DN60699_c0_g1_i1.p2 TRINITY_DN60699_c0_g1~~TRINITY_DN60699_c0_g1_i1.p2  ORF type:complete len:175 (+),score=79.04 TRINITY_DN60699_c0_g1_i1:77-526(+)